ncbi:hypothetical protein CEXT_373301 [Caerostris extrusa]|uniref:Uncharacterized protein n=1 Tax=Caerostris extrusa TaxID=172846 RepID=A0AAV4UNM9_CAEEX|nr:hypothetical protein CEXT_373301 [Caerostris extrusa]
MLKKDGLTEVDLPDKKSEFKNIGYYQGQYSHSPSTITNCQVTANTQPIGMEIETTKSSTKARQHRTADQDEFTTPPKHLAKNKRN